MHSSEPRKIQSYIWPAIKKGLDVIAVGTAKCGKTVGYVFALCGLLATNSNVIFYLKYLFILEQILQNILFSLVHIKFFFY